MLAFPNVQGLIVLAPRVIFPILGYLIRIGYKLKAMMFFAAAVILAGCASSTGVVAAGRDQHMIAREYNGPAASLGAIKVKVLQEAEAFCMGQGKIMQIVKENDVPRSLGQFPQTTLYFTCA